MGITGLHAALKPYTRDVHASAYRGKRVGCDASCWIHKGAVAVALELHLAGGDPAATPWAAAGRDAPWVEFAMKMVGALRAAGVVPVLVFDGARLPAKAPTHAARAARKAENRAKAAALLAAGNKEAAAKAFAAALDVTHEMARQLLARARQAGVECVVAPYEADAQLAHLAALPPSAGGVAAVVTEDGDLVG